MSCVSRDREPDRERGPAAELAVAGDRALVLLDHEDVGVREALTDAAGVALGREEGFEDARAHLGVDADAAVLDPDLCPALLLAGADLERAALALGLDRLGRVQ